MPSQFGLLLDELRRAQGASRPPPSMAKALSPSRGFTVADLMALRASGPSFKKMANDLGEFAKSVGARVALNGQELAQRNRATFFKSLGDARADLGKLVASGRITADAAIQAETRLNHLETRALQIVAAEVS